MRKSTVSGLAWPAALLVWIAVALSFVPKEQVPLATVVVLVHCFVYSFETYHRRIADEHDN